MKRILLAVIMLSACTEKDVDENHIVDAVNSSPTEITYTSVSKPFKISAPYPSQMPMHLVYPRPDSETQEHARHRWAHPEMLYQIPIGIQGGSWPFKYELVYGPVGAAIGNVEREESYGTIEWRPSSYEGETRFHVRVTDQEDNTLNIFWSVNVDAERFVFLQDGWSGEKRGTIESPLEDITDWYRDSRYDNTYHNKIIVFREGNYELVGSDESNGNVRLDSSSKTPSLLGFPGEQAIIDASKAKIITDTDELEDIFVANLNWQNSRQDVKNAHFFWAVGDVSRSTWWDNSFHNHGPGKVGNDNPAGVFISRTSSKKENILYKGNKHTNFYNGTLNGSLVDIYYASHVLIEDNLASNVNVSCSFLAKGTTSFVTIRDNHAFDNIKSGGICVGYGKESPEVPNNHEIAWNRIILDSPKNKSLSMLWAMQNTWEGKTYNSYVYRNTFVNGSVWIRFPGMNKYQVDSNIVITNNPRRWNPNSMTVTRKNLVKTIQDRRVVDASGLIKEAFKDEYLGKVGFELGY